MYGQTYLSIGCASKCPEALSGVVSSDCHYLESQMDAIVGSGYM